MEHLAANIANGYQRDFPLKSNPFAVLAGEAGASEAEVMSACRDILARGEASRIGAVIRAGTVGSATLAALKVPPAKLEAVAAIVSAMVQVNHNYERENDLNLWFVVASRDRTQVLRAISEIELRTGLSVIEMPMERDYFIDLGFDLKDGLSQGRSEPRKDAPGLPDDKDLDLLAALEEGLAVTPRPFEIIAEQAGMDEGECLDRLGRLIDIGVINRFGFVVRHRHFGFKANAMSVWDVPDHLVDQLGEALGAEPRVRLCYRRRRDETWKYNLYAMVHGRMRTEVECELAAIAVRCGLGGYPHQVLFSLRCFKQTGARYLSGTAPSRRSVA